jgi:hypothetical protein
VPSSLDELLADLAATPAGRRLDQLEPAVWARLQHRERRDADHRIVRVRVAAVALAMVGGALIGGLQAWRAPEPQPILFADAALAPSTLLEGRG